MVPLDGSGLAEQALPHAKALADALHVEMVLLGAPRLMGSMPPGFELAPGDISVEIGKALDSYLRGKAEDLRNSRTKTTSVHMLGQPVHEILDPIQKGPGSMVVITNHGRSDLGRVVLGSVTEGVVRHAGTPVLVVPAKAPANRRNRQLTPAGLRTYSRHRR